jgi:hypothetical protein
VAAKKSWEPYDRVRRGNGTGHVERGTVVTVHADALSVLPDDRPRTGGLVLWRLEDCQRGPSVTRACPVCGADHVTGHDGRRTSVFYCPQRASE